jgi:glutamate synthase (NADPH) large chain
MPHFSLKFFAACPWQAAVIWAHGKMERQRWLDGTLYSSDFEQDSCGFGLIAQIDNQPSHTLVQNAIGSLACMTHRGAIAADGLSGDGCGLLFKKPDAFLRAVAAEAGFALGELYAASLVFLSREAAPQAHARSTLKAELEAQGLVVAGFRRVPTDSSVCGESALESLPHIEQIFVNAAAGMSEDDFERKLYIARRRAEKALEPADPVFYLPTLSCRVISYKGLVMPDNLPVFYPDLNDARFASSLVVFHQRFSTNTWPQWRLAQPFRYLAHNGEINTVQGNRNWSRAREQKFATPLIPDMNDVRPIVGTKGSDSMSLDNMVEGLVMGGAGLFRALRLVIPPAWQNIEAMDPDIRAFYEYNSMHMEPWDGPAGIVLTDGRFAVCTLDRNGLRPARWVLTKDRILTIASEVGVWQIDPANVERKGRVRPGQMIAADLETGRLLLSEDIDNELKVRQPYRQWLQDRAVKLDLSISQDADLPVMDAASLLTHQKLFNVSFEERDQIIRVLAEDGQEAIGSMGDDTPMAVLSRKVRSPFDYLRQQFAQVTNPPIDPIREAIVMSLNTSFGPERNLFDESAEHAHRVEVRTPLLSKEAFDKILGLEDPAFVSTILDLHYDPAESSLEQAIHT